MNIRSIAPADNIKCPKTLLKISCLVAFLTFTLGTGSVQAQKISTLFAPQIYNPNDPTNTNWNEPKNWSWYPGNHIAEDVIIHLFHTSYNTIPMTIPASSEVIVGANIQLHVTSTFENRGKISGEGTLIFSQNVDNRGKIFIKNLKGKTITNLPFSTMSCYDIQVDNIINQSVVNSVTTTLTCTNSYVGNVNNFYDAVFINHGTMKGNVTNWEIDAKFINHGNFEGRINSLIPGPYPWSDVNNSGSIHLTSGTSDIDVFTNNETGRVTVDGSLMIRKKLNNKGSIINNTDFNLHPNNQNSSDSWNNTGTITTNGTLSINSFVAFNSTGVIEGSGEHIASGQWTNRGTVSPGNSPGKLTHNGQYYESGKLLIEIGGTTPESEYDVLEIGNNRSHTILTSTLEVQLLNGFNPSDGDFFTILTASARSGEFSTLDLPELDPGLEWEVEYNAMDITLRVAAIVVPVTWLDFTVSAMDREENSVQLDWSTAEEINNLGFEIERSADGNNWEQIGFETAQVRTADQYDYEFIDLNPYRGTNYYRLKQLDYDGQHEYSEVRTIEMKSGESSISVYPNPSSTGDLHLSLEKEAQGIQGVIILDLNGRIVHSKKTGTDRGNRLISITVPDLSPGTYIIKLQGENKYSQLKWVKL